MEEQRTTAYVENIGGRVKVVFKDLVRNDLQELLLGKDPHLDARRLTTFPVALLFLITVTQAMHEREKAIRSDERATLNGEAGPR
jgi:hypothetical protein